MEKTEAKTVAKKGAMVQKEENPAQLELLFTEADIVARRHELEQCKEEAHRKQIEELETRVRELEEKKRQQEIDGRESLHRLFMRKQAMEEKLKACHEQQIQCIKDVKEKHSMEMDVYKEELSTLQAALEDEKKELARKQKLIVEFDKQRVEDEQQRARDEKTLKCMIEEEQANLDRMNKQHEDKKKRYKLESDTKVQAFKEERENLTTRIDDVKKDIERRGRDFRKQETELLRRRDELQARHDREREERETKLGPLINERDGLLQRIRDVQDKIAQRKQEEEQRTAEIVRQYEDTFENNQRDFNQETEEQQKKIYDKDRQLRNKDSELIKVREQYDEKLREMENDMENRLKEMEDELRDQDEKNRKQLEKVTDRERIREVEEKIFQRACELQNLESDQHAEEAMLKVWLSAVTDKERYLRGEANRKQSRNANRITELENELNDAKLNADNEERDYESLKVDIEKKLKDKRGQFEAQAKEDASHLNELNDQVASLKRNLKDKDDAARARGEALEKRIAEEVNRLQILKGDLEEQIGPLREKHNDVKQKMAEEKEKHLSQLKTLDMEQKNQNKEQEEELAKLYFLLESVRTQFREERMLLQSTLTNILNANDQLRKKHEKEIYDLNMRLVQTLQATSGDKIDPEATKDLLNQLKDLQDQYAEKSRTYEESLMQHADEKQNLNAKSEAEIRQLKNEIKRLSQDYLKDGIQNPADRVEKLRGMLERKNKDLEKAKTAAYTGTVNQAQVMDDVEDAQKKNYELSDKLQRKKKELTDLMNKRQKDIEELTRQITEQNAEMSQAEGEYNDPSLPGSLKDRLDKLSKIRELIKLEIEERDRLLREISMLQKQMKDSGSGGAARPSGFEDYENIHIEKDIILIPAGSKGELHACVLDSSERQSSVAKAGKEAQESGVDEENSKSSKKASGESSKSEVSGSASGSESESESESSSSESKGSVIEK